MSTLHLVSQTQVLKACLSRVETGDVILLLGAGALAGLEAEPSSGNKTVAWYVLEDALEMHGISHDRLGGWIMPIAYVGFVEHACATSRSISWFA